MPKIRPEGNHTEGKRTEGKSNEGNGTQAAFNTFLEQEKTKGVDTLMGGVELDLGPAKVYFPDDLITFSLPDARSIDQHDGPWAAAFNAGRTLSNPVELNGKCLSKKKLFETLEQGGGYEPDKQAQPKVRSPEYKSVLTSSTTKRLHCRDLPPPLRFIGEIVNHILYKEFDEAIKVHLRSHSEMKSWIEVERSHVRGSLLLNCMWVFTYKFDKHRYFLK